MEHIVQFAIGIDDERIKKNITESAEKQIIGSIKNDVENMLFYHDYYGRDINKSNPKDWVVDIVREVINENKEAIIEVATAELAKNMSKTKAVKEAITKVVES